MLHCDLNNALPNVTGPKVHPSGCGDFTIVVDTTILDSAGPRSSRGNLEFWSSMAKSVTLCGASFLSPIGGREDYACKQDTDTYK